VVSTRLLALAAALVSLPIVAEGWSRYWGADPENWPDRALIRTGGAALLLALVGFDGVFGLVPDPGVPSGIATSTELALYGLAIACFVGGVLRRRGD
jgi:hypothetical protein